MKRSHLPQSNATIIAAIITGIVTIIGVVVTIWYKSNQAQTIYVSLPEVIPTITAKPTVVGTPIPGADLAAGGRIGQEIMANNVALVVDEVRAFSKSSNGWSLPPGYAWVVVKIRVANANNSPISHFDYELIDDESNKYAAWGIMGFDDLLMLPSLPSGTSGAGSLVFHVPETALANKLRLRLTVIRIRDSDLSTILEVFFDNVISLEQQPPFTPTPTLAP